MPIHDKIEDKIQIAKFFGFIENQKTSVSIFSRPRGPYSYGLSKCLNTFTMETVRYFGPPE